MSYPIAVPAADLRVRPLIMLLLLSMLVLLSGCAERGAAGDDQAAAGAPLSTGVELQANQTSLRVSRAGWQSPPDTLTWADSTARGDTTYHGKGRLITSSVLLVDSQWIQVPVRPARSGIPVGLLNLWNGTRLTEHSVPFTLTYNAETPSTIVARLATARARGIKMVTVMTGGARANYLTDGVFDFEKWKRRMDRFNTPAIQEAVSQAVIDGTLIGNTVMDEPFNSGGPGNEANSWGPPGTMSKARVDSLCGYAKTVFPTLPHGVFHDYRLSPDSSYKVCDFLTSQYRTRKGPLATYRDGALEVCKRDRHACAFAINVLDGGTPTRRTPGQKDYDADDCPIPATGGRGTYFPNCRMSAEQVREAGRVLGPAGCFLTGFRYDAEFLASPEIQRAFRDVIETLATKQPAACIRT